MKENIFKRVISIILASFICTQSIFAEGIYVNEEQSITTITVGNAETSAENEITVPISISNNVGLVGLTLAIEYNSDILTLNSIARGEALSSLALTKPGSLTLNPFKLLWDGTDADITNGSIALLEFTTIDSTQAVGDVINVTVVTACDDDMEDVETVVYQSSLANLTTELFEMDTENLFEIENYDQTILYENSATTKITEFDIASELEGIMTTYDRVKYAEEESCVPYQESLTFKTLNKTVVEDEIETIETNSEISSINVNTTNSLPNFNFDRDLFKTFNTITAPMVENGANEPKFSYNSFLEEKISDYSGELTLNLEDLVLDGVNGLDLRIGRTYQTAASNPVEKSTMLFLDENNDLKDALVFDYSSYLMDRYNLGTGWGFSFPSVQVETEYVPGILGNDFYYDTESQLYYHAGNGDVYQVDFTKDETDSNLKGYYNKDIQFNEDDTYHLNDKETSSYSMTLADQTKQYFTEDGRLISIVDRFENEIKFEYEPLNITNRVPGGNFWFDEKNDNNIDKPDNYIWESSVSNDGLCDAYPVKNTDIGSNDGYVMYFERANSVGDPHIISQPIKVKPDTEYNIGMRFKSLNNQSISVEIIGYDTIYRQQDLETKTASISNKNEWISFNDTFRTSTEVRYIQIKITPDNATGLCIDSVTLDEPKPLLSKITDTVGRTVTFEYQRGITTGENTGAVVLTITSPDGSNTRTLTYNKEAKPFDTDYMGYDEQRLVWYLNNSSTEGDDGSTVKYTYEGGTTTNADGTLAYPKLFLRYNGKTHHASDGWINKPVLSHVRYKDRQKVYEYETVRKHLGKSGYYDTLRVKKKYDEYAYVPDGSESIDFKGNVGTVNYSYSGLCNGLVIDNETAYDEELSYEDISNIQWTVTKTGKTTDTTTFNDDVIVQKTSNSDGATITSDYTNHSDFKNSPIQIKNTITQNGVSKNTYILYSYNEWGGVSSETKEVDEATKNNESLLEKYTTTYLYHPDYHYIMQKSYYNNIDSLQVHEINEYDKINDHVLLISSQNAAKEKTIYSYDNTEYPFLVTKTTMDDPMGFYNMLGGDKVVEYEYDAYGLYPVTISETHDEGVANTSYEYDYITGDVLKETLPDGSYTEYGYYSDGKIKVVISPFARFTDGRLFYTIEQHQYIPQTICENYEDEVRTYEAEYTTSYILFGGENNPSLYSGDINFYDAVGNLKMTQKYDFSKTNEDKSYLTYSTKYYHGDYDRLIKTVDNEGHATRYTYDGFDRPITITDSESNVYTYTYDSVQNKVHLSLDGATESSDRQLATQYFDLYGNVIENVVYPNNSSQTLNESYEYDLNNNIISHTNANGNKTEYLYDAANRLIETVLPNGIKASSTYSVFNKPAFEKIYDIEGNERLARITYRNEKGDLGLKFFNYDERMVDTDRYSTDAKGRLNSINEGENVYSLIYDELDHPIVLTSGTSQIQRKYCPFGETVLVSTDGNTPTITYGYDALGNLGEKKQNNVHSMKYTYSSIGNITEITMPSERTEEYTYTPNGNLDTISSGTKTFDYNYYDNGFVESITYPGDLKTTYEYDNINRITKIITSKGNSVINTFEYEYDNNGNTTKEIRNGAITSYSYDSLDRLISVTYNDRSSVTYEYDALNNRTKETYSNDKIKDYVYDEKYQLKEIKLNGQVTDTFTYNESGAVITHNDKTYTYDEWDRMSGYSDGTNTYTYKYDANGIRTQKNDKQYIIDINNNVVAETDSTGAITDEILWGHQPLARRTNGSWYYYIYNAHGDVVGLVNDSGTVVNTYEYTPWGEIRSETETIDNPIKYAGEYYDDELDMIYLRARYYNPQIGRFTSHDIEEGEIANPLDMNRYVYCRNNPIKYVDPSGEVATWVILALYEYAQTVVTSPDLQNDMQMLTYDISQGDYFSAAFGLVDVLLPGFSGSRMIPKFIRKYFDDAVTWVQYRKFDDVIKGSTFIRKTKGGTKMYDRIGGYQKALDDFYALKLKDIKKYENGAITGVMQDGTIVNLHQSHTDNMKWTLQKGKEKIRYI